jgi:hypothetical protein
MAERKFGFTIKLDEEAIKQIIDKACVNVFGDKPARYTKGLREQINLLICESLKWSFCDEAFASRYQGLDQVVDRPFVRLVTCFSASEGSLPAGVLGAIAQFEKAGLVAKLAAARWRPPKRKRPPRRA